MSVTAFVSAPRVRATVGFRQLAAQASQPHAVIQLASVEAHAELVYRAARASALWVRSNAAANWRKLSIAAVSFVPAVIFNEEAVALVEGRWFHFAKGADDEVAVSDAHVVAFAKRFAEPVSAAELLAIDLIRGAMAELQAVSDRVSLTPALVRADLFAAADLAALTPLLAKADAITASDAISRTVGAVRTDTALTSEVLAKNLSRTIAETAEVFDTIFLDRGGSAYQERVTSGDNFYFQVQPGFSEAVSLLEVLRLIVTRQVFGKSKPDALPMGEWMLGD